MDGEDDQSVIWSDRISHTEPSIIRHAVSETVRHRGDWNESTSIRWVDDGFKTFIVPWGWSLLTVEMFGSVWDRFHPLSGVRCQHRKADFYQISEEVHHVIGILPSEVLDPELSGSFMIPSWKTLSNRVRKQTDEWMNLTDQFKLFWSEIFLKSVQNRFMILHEERFSSAELFLTLITWFNQ